MLALCVESSHERGMGHFFRALNFVSYLDTQQERCVVLVNGHVKSLELLDRKKISYEVVPLHDLAGDWETAVIRKHDVNLWINDRLDTDIRHARSVKQYGVKLVTFDDHGSGAEEADLHFAPMTFDDAPLQGRKILRGPSYLVLNREIDQYKKPRTRLVKIVVSMGGSDTYGITVKVVELLKQHGISATVIVGPGFEHERELQGVVTPAFQIKRAVPSLIEELSHYDVAITGGGVTAFEACASGLPCIIVAAELFEVLTAKYLEGKGGAVFAGFHTDIDRNVFDRKLDIEKMSHAGMTHIATNGAENIYRQLKALL